MSQLYANVSLANTFNVWRIRTNEIVDFVNNLANTVGVANIKTSNAVSTIFRVLNRGNIDYDAGDSVLRIQSSSSAAGGIDLSVTGSGLGRNIKIAPTVTTFYSNTTLQSKRTTISSSNTYITSNVTFNNTGAIKIPVGSTAQRSAHNSAGHFRYNLSSGYYEGRTGSAWVSFATVGSFIANTTFQSALANTNSYIKSQLANTNSYIKSQLANTNSYIAKKYAVSNVESKFVANTYAQATFSTVTAALSKSSATEQTIQPSVVVANTFIAQKGAPIKTVSANTYTLIIGDNGKYIRMSNTGGVTLTIPNSLFPIGAEIVIIHSGGNNSMTFANAAGVTLNSRLGVKVNNYRYSPCTIKAISSSEFDLAGV